MTHQTFPEPAPRPKAKRRPLPPRSPKGQSYDEELFEISPLIVTRSRGLCECGCGRQGHAVHHRKRRSQGGPNTLANLLWLNDECHAKVHANPNDSYVSGLLIRRYAEITPYGGLR